MEQGNRYVTCSDGSTSAAGVCPPGAEITGPVLLYLQAATVPGVPPEDLGKQALEVDEVGLFLQDTWQATDRVVLNLGLRWEGTWNPDPLIAPQDTYFAPYLDDPRFPSDGTIPDATDNFQPRLGLVWDASGDGSNVLRLNAGSYVSRIPSLVLAGPRTTNGAFQQVLFRSSAASPTLGPVPPIDQQIDGSDTLPFLPDITVVDRDLELPETWSFGAGFERRLGRGMTAELAYQHARTDELFRFVDRNHAAFGSPFGVGTHPGGGGTNALTNTESSARSRYHDLTATLRGRNAFDGLLTFEVSYTLSRDRRRHHPQRPRQQPPRPTRPPPPLLRPAGVLGCTHRGRLDTVAKRTHAGPAFRGSPSDQRLTRIARRLLRPWRQADTLQPVEGSEGVSLQVARNERLPKSLQRPTPNRSEWSAASPPPSILRPRASGTWRLTPSDPDQTGG